MPCVWTCRSAPANCSCTDGPPGGWLWHAARFSAAARIIGPNGWHRSQGARITGHNKHHEAKPSARITNEHHEAKPRAGAVFDHCLTAGPSRPWTLQALLHPAYEQRCPGAGRPSCYCLGPLRAGVTNDTRASYAMVWLPRSHAL
jgi:hypothetical protein